MTEKHKFLVIFGLLIFSSLACSAVTGAFETPAVAVPTETTEPTTTGTPTMTPTALPPRPVDPGEENPDEPVFITGDIPFTSPFFLDTIAEAFVLLEDQGGFVNREKEFTFPLVGQTIGPGELIDDDTVRFQLALPAIPQGTQVDVDNNDHNDPGVQIFAVAYWSNTWGGPFLEERDGVGWSGAYASTITDADRDYEIDGGILIVWAPDDEQGFPIDYGDDGLLFTADDPTAAIPAGYTLVNLDESPFLFYKEARPELTLFEGDIAVNDYSEMAYTEAFEALFEKVSREYPFTEYKEIDWESLYVEYMDRMAGAKDDEDFFWGLKDFSLEIPDGHVGISFNELVAQIFFENHGGSFGMILTETDDPSVLVTSIFHGAPAESAGIEVGAEIILWDGVPVTEAVSAIQPFLGPYSTTHQKRFEQLVFLTRVAPGDSVEIDFKNPDSDVVISAEIEAVVEYDSLFTWIPSLSGDELALPIEAEVLDESGLGYIKINTFSDDYNLMAQLWDRIMRELIDLEVPGIILDLRVNGGGNSGLANNFAGYFFGEEVWVMRRSYHNEISGVFEYIEPDRKIKPGPVNFDGPVVVLVGPYCVSACEGFSYSMSLREDVLVIGHTPSAGAYGEVGRGQYDLPADLSVQFPTGRSEDMDGNLLIEGVGVVPDILVPVTRESALGQVDVVLEAAIEALSD